MKKMRRAVSEDCKTVDMLSSLPKELIHKIMLLLSPQDLTRTSVLSKTFLSLFRSIPVLDLDFDCFFRSRPLSHLNWATELLEFVQNSVRSRDSGQDTLERLSFSVRYYWGSTYHNSCLEAAVQLIANFALTNRARQVVLDFSAARAPPFPLCSGLLGSQSKSISTIALTGLSIADIVYECPSLEYLDLLECSSEFINLAGHILKTVKIRNCIGFKNIEIHPATTARCLESFTFYIDQNFHHPEFEIAGLASCSALKILQLKSLGLSDNRWFTGDVSIYSGLEALVLMDCDAVTRIWGRNCSLKTLELQGCRAIERIDMVAPNLRDLRLNYVSLASFPGQFRLLESLALESCNSIKEIVLNSNSLRRLKITGCEILGVVEINALNLISFDYDGSILLNPILKSGIVHSNLTLKLMGYDKLKVLTKFLSHFGHPKNLTLSCISSETLTFPWQVRDSLLSPLYDLQHLTISLERSDVQNFPEFVDSLLWLAPNPKTISMALGCDRNVRLIFHYRDRWDLHEEDKEDGLSCCMWKPIKCWKHHLDRVDLEAFQGFRDESNLRRYFRMHANATLALK